MNIEKLKQGETYKNYKILCEVLDEPNKTGESKQYQLRDWERYFSYHKDGHKFVIDEIFEVPAEKIDGRVNNGGSRSTNKEIDGRVNNGGSHNTKNLDIIIPVLQDALNKNDYNYKVYNMTSLLCDVVKVFNDEVCKIVYADEKILEKYCKENDIKNMQLFRDYVSMARQFAKKLVLDGLSKIFEDDEDEGYSVGYQFTYQLSKRNKGHFFCDEVNDEIKAIETEVCNELNDELEISKTMTGRRLLFSIYADEVYREQYNMLKIKKIMADEKIMDYLNYSSYKEESKLFTPVNEESPLLYYCEAVYIGCVVPEENTTDITLADLCRLVCEKARKLTLNKYTKREGIKFYKYRDADSLDDILAIEKILFTEPIELDLSDELLSLYVKDKEYAEELELLFG